MQNAVYIVPYRSIKLKLFLAVSMHERVKHSLRQPLATLQSYKGEYVSMDRMVLCMSQKKAMKSLLHYAC